MRLLLKAACASAILKYAEAACEIPFEVGRTLLQVQYVPRDAKAIEDYEEEEAVDEIVRLASLL
jgi:fusion and transport protein UGO1